MNRREFLRVSAASAASLTSAARGAGVDTAGDLEALTHPALLALLGSESVRNIGKQYRALVPGENERAPLRAAILAGRPVRVPWAPRSWITQLVRSDFAAGRTVLVNGWVLSATEARQCALFSLLPAPA
ncbi:MAG TPA: hypothetical protein VEK77_09505 [Gemmatimonadales bacterium]|nr:hypothetical protein [Gemmatimonadales bacterium]